MRTNSSQHPLQIRDFSGLPFNQANQRNTSRSIFVKWAKQVSLQLNSTTSNDALAEDELSTLVVTFESDMNTFCEELMTYFASPILRDEKKAYLRSNVRLIVRLLNKVDHLSKAEAHSPELATFFGTLTSGLAACLEFMEELFYEDFDGDEKVPPVLLQKRKRELQILFQQVLFSFSGRDEPTSSICHFLFKNVEQFLADENRPIRFKDLIYHKELLEDLTVIASNPSFRGIQETLYYHNYNHEAFLDAECERLIEKANGGTSDKQRIALLKLEQKTINQLPVKLNWGYSDSLPPLKQQINNWINEEIKYLESGYAHHSSENKIEVSSEKIQTTLSVAKLAIIIRLLVLDKIIINRSVAPMLKIVAGVFTTLQRENISFNSLESKYHAPDKAAVNMVREMLFKWINILGKL